MTDPAQEGDTVEERLDTLATEMLGALPPPLARQYAGRLNAAVAASAEHRSFLLAARVEELERAADFDEKCALPEARELIDHLESTVRRLRDRVEEHKEDAEHQRACAERCQEALREAMSVPDNDYDAELPDVTYVNPRDPRSVLMDTREILSRALSTESNQSASEG